MKTITDKSQIWDVIEVPLTHNLGDRYPNPEGKMLVRSDNNKRITITDNNYPVINNKKTYDNLIDAANEIGIKTPTIQFDSAFGGKSTIFQLKIPSVNIRKEEIKRWLVTFNSFDKSKSYGTDYLTNPIWCNNQFYSKYRNAAKIRHIGDMENKLSKFIENFISAYENNQREAEVYKHMAETKWDPEDNEEFVYNLLELNQYEEDPKTKDYVIDEDGNYVEMEYSVRTKNKIDNLLDSIDMELSNRGFNQWALYNGITYYTNHVVNRKNKSTYLMFNEGRKLPNRALDLLQTNFIN